MTLWEGLTKAYRMHGPLSKAADSMHPDTLEQRVARLEAFVDEFMGARVTLRAPKPDRLDDVTL